MPADALHQLLRSLFSPDELRRFLAALPAGEEVIAALPVHGATTDDILEAATGVLRRRGLIGVELFLRLLSERPGRHRDIRTTAVAYDVVLPLRDEIEVLLAEGFDATVGARIVELARELPRDRQLLRESSITLALLTALRSSGFTLQPDVDARSPLTSRITALADEFGAERPPAPPVSAKRQADPVSALLDEIAAHVQQNDGERASLRLLDLARLRSCPRLQMQQTILLSARVQAWRLAHGSLREASREAREEWIGLLREVLTSADQLAVLQPPTARSAASSLPHALPMTLSPVEPTPASKPLFRGTGLSKRFAQSKTFELRGVDLELRPGSITGVVGPNGAGKTTLLRLVAGELLADAGTLAYPALDPAAMKGKPIDWLTVRHCIGYVPQRPEPWHGPLLDNLHAWTARHGIRGQQNVDDVEFTLHRLGLTPFRKKRWSQISGGYQTRFELARALLARPRLLVLDEPLAPLDVISQHHFLQDLRDLTASSTLPSAVLISSQHIHEIEEFSDSMLCLGEDGAVKFSGPISNLRETSSERVIELAGDIPPEVFDQFTVSLGRDHVVRRGSVLILWVPPSIKAGDLLRAVQDAGGTPTYFRDITSSTMRLFHRSPG